MSQFAALSRALFILLASLYGTRSVALSCGPGKYASGKNCLLCPPGTYQNLTFSTSCTPCPQGSYNAYSGAPGVDVCAQCPPGTFLNYTGAVSSNECSKCPKGTSSPPGSYACISCPRNHQMALCPLDYTYIPGICAFFYSFNVVESYAKPSLVCRPCFRGLVLSEDGFTCKECVSPLVPDRRGKACVLCRPGYGHNYQDSKCHKCKMFEFQDGVSGFCRKCPRGMTGNAAVGATSCVPCPKGTFGRRGLCQKCKKGENSFAKGAHYCRPDNLPCATNFFRSANGVCQKCSRMERYDRKRTRCVPCKSNQASMGGFSEKCKNCQKGAVGTLNGCVCDIGKGMGRNGKCQPCQPGSVKGSKSNKICHHCTPGSYAPRAGMKECLRCPAGTVQPDYGQNHCSRVKCGKNQYPNKRDEVLPEFGCVLNKTNCPPGTERIHAFDTGFLIYCNPLSCPPGSFIRDSNVDDFRLKQCFKCGTRKPKLDASSRRCVGCGRGEINTGTRKTLKCVKCGVGFQAEGGRCMCSNGQVVNGKCISCPVGTFRTVDRICIPCPAGTFSAELGSHSCWNCGPGSFSIAGAKECKPCPAGTTTFGEGEANCLVPIRSFRDA